MKKLFNHTKRPEQEWENFDESEYDWDSTEEDAGDEVQYADEYEEEGEYFADSDGVDEDGEYYAEEAAEGGEYYAEEATEGGEYYAEEAAEDGEYYAEEAAEGGEYYAEEAAEDGEYYAEEAVEGGEYYAEEAVEDGEYYAEEAAEDGEYYAEEASEDADYYEDEAYEKDEYAQHKPKKEKGQKKGLFAKMCESLKNMTAMDRVIMATGVGVLILALVTGSVFVSAHIVENQVSDFVNVGKQLDGIATIGETGLLAVADAQLARIAASSIVEEEEKNYEEEVYEREITVALSMTSIQKDLKVKFINKKTDKLVANVPFAVTVTDPDGNTSIWSDDDMDGIIYKKDIAPGDYKVAMEELTDAKYADYIISTDTKTVEVKKDIEYKKVDVANEVKAETEINAKKEDTKKNETTVESALQDTVAWVDSKVLSATYNEVSKSNIPNPLTLVLNKSFMRMTTTATGGISSSELKLKVGEEATLTASCQTNTTEGTVKDCTITNINWASSNTSVATVDNNGKVKAVAAGESTISYTAKAKITVESSQPTPTAEPTTAPTAEPTTTPIVEPTPTPTAEPTSTPSTETPPESVSSPEASEPSESSITRGVSTAFWAASSNTVRTTGTIEEVDISGSCKVIVSATGTITFNPTSVTVVAGKTATSTASVSGFTATNWAVVPGDATIATATIGSDGKITVTGVKAGTSKIVVTATGANNATASAELSVTVGGNKKLTLDKTSATVFISEPVTINATIENATASDPTVTAESSDTNIAKVTVDKKAVKIEGVKAGSCTITVKYKENEEEVSATCAVTVKNHPKDDTTTRLKDSSGNLLYIYDNGTYKEATYADYFKYDKFYIKGATRYSGWQTLDGKVYYFTAEGNKVTGEQVIQGAKYNFASDGSLVTGNGSKGIDVSKWNGTIDWNAVKNSGVEYVIIRCGYRGSSQGSLIEDPKYASNIKGATAVGLKVGVYFFTQAVDEREAVEEASMVLEKVKNYKISYPIFLDVESSGGRADSISKETRTAVCKAFCQTIQNAGYTAGIYANKTWLETKLDASALSAYKIWLAQYAATPTYKGRYDLWQYRSTGNVTGISGNVDMNISYLGY